MKKLSVFLIAILFILVLTACGPKSTTATGYGLVHGHYVGVANITVDKDGIVTALELEEYFLPYSWATVAASHADRDDVVARAWSRGTSQFTTYYAKYITIGDKNFTAEVLGTAPSQSINYKATGIANLEEWLKIEANAKWYVEQADAGLYKLANSNFTANTVLVNIDVSATTSIQKSLSGYWVTEAPRLGWAGNAQATIDVIIGLDLSGDFTFTRDSAAAAGSQFWSYNDIVTGATWSDFPDYFNLAIRAYNNATK